MKYTPVVRLLVSTPKGVVPLTTERSLISLPRGPEGREILLTYGPYLGAVARFLTGDDFGPLREALELHFGRPVTIAAIHSVEVISEKHGALYHVIHLRVETTRGIASFAINVATSREQRSLLEFEYSLMEELHDRFHLPHLPRTYLRGEAHYEDQTSRIPLGLFLCEWFEDYYEFHLTLKTPSSSQAMVVWDLKRGDALLSPPQVRALYMEAASILTSYLDEETFAEIYPWHHAAGDFIVKIEEDRVRLRLITVRGYRPLTTVGEEPFERWMALLRFVLNLTIRMRIDRLDGTGELAWAGPECIPWVLSGFLGAWDEKASRCASLPPSEILLELMRQLSQNDWLSMAQAVATEGMVEAEETPFLLSRLGEHAAEFHTTVEKWPA